MDLLDYLHIYGEDDKKNEETIRTTRNKIDQNSIMSFIICIFQV